MSNELKPCPFCGSTDLYVVQARIEEYHSVEPEISCKKCCYTIKLKELAIAIDESPKTNADRWDRGVAKKWNTRPAEDVLKAEIERLKAALTDMCEMWSAIGNLMPPLLVEQKYLNATAVLVNAPATNAGSMEESR